MDPNQSISLRSTSIDIYQNPDDGYLFLEQPVDEIKKTKEKVKKYLISTHFKNYHIYVQKIDNDKFKIKIKDTDYDTLDFDFKKFTNNEIAAIKLHQEAMFLVQRHAK